MFQRIRTKKLNIYIQYNIKYFNKIICVWSKVEFISKPCRAVISTNVSTIYNLVEVLNSIRTSYWKIFV